MLGRGLPGARAGVAAGAGGGGRLCHYAPSVPHSLAHCGCRFRRATRAVPKTHQDRGRDHPLQPKEEHCSRTDARRRLPDASTAGPRVFVGEVGFRRSTPHRALAPAGRGSAVWRSCGRYRRSKIPNSTKCGRAKASRPRSRSCVPMPLGKSPG
jgi:hypothetical protein